MEMDGCEAWSSICSDLPADKDAAEYFKRFKILGSQVFVFVCVVISQGPVLAHCTWNVSIRSPPAATETSDGSTTETFLMALQKHF
jgi:hypothetical protein